MRLSRKAGILASGIIWFKYECEEDQELRDSPYISNWVIVGEGHLNDGVTITGRTSWYYGGGASTNYFDTQGATVTLSVTNPGTVYQVNSDGTVLTEFVVQIEDDGVWVTESRKTLTHNYYYVQVFNVGDCVGRALASEGEYPDVKKGFTYAATKGEYTIMQDRNGNYFAYKKA
jgi:hypothetical protein